MQEKYLNYAPRLDPEEYSAPVSSEGSDEGSEEHGHSDASRACGLEEDLARLLREKTLENHEHFDYAYLDKFKHELIAEKARARSEEEPKNATESTPRPPWQPRKAKSKDYLKDKGMKRSKLIILEDSWLIKFWIVARICVILSSSMLYPHDVAEVLLGIIEREGTIKVGGGGNGGKE